MAVTAANLVSAAQTHANMQVDGPWSPAEWQLAIDRAMEALWQVIIAKQPTFRVTSATLNISSTSVPSASLPADFMNMLEVVKDANTPNRIPIPRYSDQFAAGPFQRTFRIENDSLYIDPMEQAVGAYQVRYNPIITVPVVTMDAELAQFREFVELHAAISALDAEETPTASLVRRLYGPKGVQERVESWASKQRSAEPNRIRDVRARAPAPGLGMFALAGGSSMGSMLEFTAVGAFSATIPADCAFIILDGWGGGGGGGSGAVGVAGTAGGGGGGGSGGRSTLFLPRGAFGATIAGIVGAGGAGGAGQTTDNTAGTVGASGTATTVGTIFSAGAGSGGAAGGTAGAGSGGAAGTGGANGGAGGTAGAGGVGNTGTQAVTTSGGGAGGGGGGANQLGGIGGQGSTITTQGSVSTILVAAGAAGAINGAGGNGATVITGVTTATGGGGGGGGGGGNAANGGAGGNGSLLSAAGGGSGAAANGFDTAKGGDGAPGKLVAYFV